MSITINSRTDESLLYSFAYKLSEDGAVPVPPSVPPGFWSFSDDPSVALDDLLTEWYYEVAPTTTSKSFNEPLLCLIEDVRWSGFLPIVETPYTTAAITEVPARTSSRITRALNSQGKFHLPKKDGKAVMKEKIR
ncbi:hypothetical protein SISSUDRAFT_1066538 [Sistotremastrum suecicum HHB10207 ss-3]|uniref:Uncharacterized protein n=1 Tax=Sistotremastrum suecicum HHB10207 ss-3 TaxID=1314776 RepID=A0A165Y7C5_9AGAM|nr:hypothetical protein SISSUDRAFT_1066538 [Sistotremastrum suecicum HHB10207 ss-3]